jgi:DNA-binding winged helix-turn-helix (wHTH) protein
MSPDAPEASSGPPTGRPDVDTVPRRTTTCRPVLMKVVWPERLAAGESGRPEWRIVMASAQCAERVALATGPTGGVGFEAARRLGETHMTALIGGRDHRRDQGVREGSHANGTFWLDTMNEYLWRAGVPIDLTPKAFAVLRYLVEHPGRLVTQQELLDALWPDVHVQPEIVKTYIRDIRRILGDQPKAARFIETRPRRGYTFVAAVTNESDSVAGTAVGLNGGRDIPRDGEGPQRGTPESIPGTSPRRPLETRAGVRRPSARELSQRPNGGRAGEPDALGMGRESLA